MPDASFKPHLLGSKVENAAGAQAAFSRMLDGWFETRRSLFADDPPAISVAEQCAGSREPTKEFSHEPA